jgi:hypothetical protein
MSQSRTMSLVESIANVLAGFGVAVATQIAIFPLFGLRTTLAENLAMGAIFTVVSDRPVVLPAKGVRADSGPCRMQQRAARGLFKRSGRSVRVPHSSRTPH